MKGEESHLKALQNHIESSAFLTKGPKNSGQQFTPYPRKNDHEKVNRDDLFCTFCSRRGHSKEKCWKLHGRPPHLEAPAPPRAHLVCNSRGVAHSGIEGTHTAPDLQTIMSELQSLKSIMNSTNTVIGSTSISNFGKHLILASISLFTKDLSRAWILDFRATDHMTSSEKSFESYEKLA